MTYDETIVQIDNSAVKEWNLESSASIVHFCTIFCSLEKSLKRVISYFFKTGFNVT